MARLIAFLRAINVGGRNVSMARLKQLFEELGLDSSETLLASGNVAFETRSRNLAALESRIEAHLELALGYPVATFVRRPAELVAIASLGPVPEQARAQAQALNVALLKEPVDARARQKLRELETDIDAFYAGDREIYWLCGKSQSKSTFSNAVLERALGRQATLRGVATIEKLVARFAT